MQQFILGVLCALVVQANAALRPNIVVILADDMGYADIGVHGCRDIPTPHIDRIAREGVRFTSAYANGSYCTPTRVALMSCRYQQRSGNDDLPQVTGPLPLKIKTFADRLKEAGYLTGMVGKWHLGSNPGYTPLERGFDEFFGFLGGGHHYLPNPKGYSSGYNEPILSQTNAVPYPEYLTDAFGDEAAAYLKRHRNTEQPLFLYLAFNAVHTPLQATDKYLDRFPRLTGKRRIYAGMLSAMDDAIGKVLDELDASGRADNSLVIFHNDNGGPTTRNAVNGSSNAPLRGSKCETFEGGIRVPLAMRWPHVIKPGTTYDQPVMSFDLNATALALAKGDSTRIDGVNLLPFLAGKKQGSPHESLFWRSRTRNNNYAVRRGDWKYVCSTEGTERPGPNQTPARDYLFNLAEDLGEQDDQSEKYPEILRELKQLYAKWDVEMDASCRELGIDPPQIRNPSAPKSGKRGESNVGKFQATKSFPDFDTLNRVQVKKTKLGYELASNGGGLALRRLEETITGKITMTAIIQPADAFPSNGFIAFGKNPTDAETVKLGLLVGGNRIAVYDGPYGSKSSSGTSAKLQGNKPYPATITINIPDRKIIAKVAGKTLSHTLPESIDEIRHVGYYVVRTRSEFGPVELTSR